MNKKLLGLLAVLVAVSLIAYVIGIHGNSNSQLARAFTVNQITAILDLLKAFNVEEGTVDEIRTTLLNTSTDSDTSTEESTQAESSTTTTEASTSASTTTEGVAADDTIEPTEETTAATGPPACSFTADRLQPIRYDTITFSWNTASASSVSFNTNTTNTSGVYDLPLPADALDLSGAAEVTANSVGRHIVELEVTGDLGEESCFLTIEVLRENATGYYEGKMDGSVFIGTVGVTRDVAIEHCEGAVADNPDADIVCTWRGDQIYPVLQ